MLHRAEIRSLRGVDTRTADAFEYSPSQHGPQQIAESIEAWGDIRRRKNRFTQQRQIVGAYTPAQSQMATNVTESCFGRLVPEGNDVLLQRGRREQRMRPTVRRTTLSLAVIWLALVAGLGSWISQRIVTAQLASLAASAEYETKTTVRVMDRLFTEMVSVANMVARQSLVIELAMRYRTDPPGAAELTRQERALQFTRDPLVRRVGDVMNALASDLRYARIYMNNMSDDTVTASNWAEPDSIVGMIYSGRPYLIDALRTGNGHSFGIARLNKSPSYFVASRIEDSNDVPLGSVTVKFDAVSYTHLTLPTILLV